MWDERSDTLWPSTSSCPSEHLKGARDTLPPAGGSRLRVASRLGGRLDLHVLETDPAAGRASVAAILTGGRFVVNGAIAVDEAALARPFRFGLTERGAVTDFAFDSRHAPAARQALETLVRGLQIELSPVIQAAWGSREVEADGTYEVSYQWDGGPATTRTWRLQKRWIRRAEVAGEAVAIARRVRESTGSIALDDGDTWVGDVAWSRITEDAHGASLVGVASTAFTARRMAPSDEIDPVGDFAEDATAPGWQPHAAAASEAPASAAPPMPDVGAAFSARQGRDYVGARDELLLLLRSHAAAPAALARYLDDLGESHGSRLALTLWRLLATAGTAEAQGVLVECFQGRGYGETSRDHALMAVRAVPRPSEILIDGLWGFHDRTSGATGPDRERNRIALLAIGSLGNARYEDAEGAARIGDQLVARLSTASSSGERRAILTALGNQGSVRTVPAVLRWAQAEDPGIRSAAVRAFRRVEDPKAAAGLRALFAGEPDLGVRTSILSTLGEMPSDPIVTARWALEQLPAASEVRLQEGLVHLLGPQAATDPAVEAALRALLVRHPAKAVRRALYAYIRE